MFISMSFKFNIFYVHQKKATNSIRLELRKLSKIKSARLIHVLDPYILTCVIMKLNYLVLWVLYLIIQNFRNFVGITI